MKPAAFELFRPQSLDEALHLLAGHDDARLLAGGQSLVPLLNFRLATPGVIIDLNRVGELSGIWLDGRTLRIRAMTRQQELIENPLVAQHAPLLAAATRRVGHVQTRSRGTVGGSLAHADPSAELPAALVALDAQLKIRSVRGTRNTPVRAFFRDALVSDLAPDEILVEIVVPCAGASARHSFHELARRHGACAIVAAAQCDPPEISVALAGLEATPRLCTQLMDFLRGSRLSRDGIEAAIERELAAVTANSDLQASGEFRIHLARVLLRDCLNEVLPA
jgi:carbon-monoxide dehydrogenase medium subunit/2-furoyl-CoA dehydrogenase FAD binding subunit